MHLRRLLHTKVYAKAEVQLVSRRGWGCLNLEMEVPQRVESTARAQIRDPKEPVVVWPDGGTL